MTFDNKSLSKEDFKRIYTKANEVLVVSKCIDGFPFSVSAFVKEMSDVSLCSYSRQVRNLQYLKIALRVKMQR